VKVYQLIGSMLLLLTGEAHNFAQEEKMEVSGYVSTLPAASWAKDDWLEQGLVHNRFNIYWYPTSSLSGSLQLRNQFMHTRFFDTSKETTGFTRENYALPLTGQIGSNNHLFFSSGIDRAWLQFTHNKLEITVGRQRINWGQTFVWNPNNIFNTYNFFDFDYPERPGADAVRVQYYPNYNSSAEIAAKVDSAGNITGAGLYKFTQWNVEMQIMAGYYSHSNCLRASDSVPSINWDDNDLALGLGFSGGLGAVSLRGEASYFKTLRNNSISKDQFLSSFTIDYTLANELGMMFEFYFVDNVQFSGSLTNLYGVTQSIKTLAFTRYNLFTQISYPIIPILTGSFGGMYFYDNHLRGFYMSPSLELSLYDNLSLATYYQLFTFHFQENHSPVWGKASRNYAFLQLKWNF